MRKPAGSAPKQSNSSERMTFGGELPAALQVDEGESVRSGMNRRFALGCRVAATMVLVGTVIVRPATAETAKCERAIEGAAAKYAQTRTKALAKCHLARVSGKLPYATDCLTEFKTASALAKASVKMASTIGKACGGNDKVCGGDTSGEDLPSSVGWPSQCPNFEQGGCSNSITDCSGIVTCLSCIHNNAIDQTIRLSFNSLAASDPETQKSLNKCQRAYGKASADFLRTKTKVLHKCWAARLKGKHNNDCPTPGDGIAAEKIAAATTKHQEAICKACGGADHMCDGVDDFTPSQVLGSEPECLAVSDPDGANCGAIGAIDSLSDMVECSSCVTSFKGACMDRSRVPDLASYPAACNASQATQSFCDLPGSILFTTDGTVVVPGGSPGAPDLSFLHLPDGFCAHYFGNVGNASQLRFAPGGELFVTSPTTPTTDGGIGGNNAIMVLPDDNLDGLADSATPFLGSLPSTQGLLFANGYLYFQDGTRIERLPYSAGDRTASGTPEQVADISIYSSGLNWPKALDIADDGTIFVTNGGDQAESCDPGRPFHGGILELDGSPGGNPVARGFRFPTALRCARGHNQCFATEMAPDYSAAQGGREKLVPVRQGDDWGFSCCASRDVPYSSVMPVPDCSTVAAEDVSFLVGDRPFDIDFETGNWPAPWKDRVYVTLHGATGSWEGARVASLELNPTTGQLLPGSDTGGVNTGAMTDFATGWDNGTLSNGRPRNLAFAPDGRLFVANASNGDIIWIFPITPSGAATATPTATSTSAAATPTPTSIPEPSATPTSASGCAGQMVGGFCWFLGSSGDSCTTTCSAAGRTYDPATDTYAGSNGTNGGCAAVLDALLGPDMPPADTIAGAGIGCASKGARLRITDPPTDAAANAVGHARACACS